MTNVTVPAGAVVDETVVDGSREGPGTEVRVGATVGAGMGVATAVAVEATGWV